MVPVNFPESNTEFIYHASMDKVYLLPAHVTNHPDLGGIATSCWELTDEELDCIQQTRQIWLTVCGKTSGFSLNLKNPSDKNVG